MITEKAGPRDSKILELLTRRNDPLLNAHCVPWVMAWLANMDFRPILSTEAPLAYASKYVSKAEPASNTYVDVLKSVMSHLENNTIGAVAYQKLLSSVVAERDMPGMSVTLSSPFIILTPFNSTGSLPHHAECTTLEILSSIPYTLCV
jgi:hypothetical protein